jgi:hypothetical protein
MHPNGVPVCPDCDEAVTQAQKKPAEGKNAGNSGGIRSA